MKIFIKILLFIITAQCISSCAWIKNATTPYFAFTNFKVPDGTPKFQAGYKDGCSTALYSRGTVLYRNRYSYKFDPKMIDDPEYNFGHNRGYGWCFMNAVGASGIRGSGVDAIHPYESSGYDPTHNPSSIKSFGGIMSNKQMWKMNYYNINDVFSPFKYGTDGSSTLTNNLLWSSGYSGGFFTFK